LRSDSETVRTATKTGAPSCPTRGYVSGVVAAMRMGGCGFWYGLGMMQTSWNWKYFPWCEKRSWVQAFVRISSVSRNRSRLSLYGMLKPW